ncbi:syncytin-A-like [Anomaloglossus baeobatrachus]
MVAQMYPPYQWNESIGYGITPYPGNYACFERTAQGLAVGKLPPNFCNSTIKINNGPYDDSLFTNQHSQLPDVYWLCGDMKIRPRLQVPWIGQCALVKVLMPFHIFELPEINKAVQEHQPLNRQKRESEIKGSFDPHVYVDSIGVPRGVPDEFKARNQVAAGFESIVPIITVNKNVDWINYLYYNQQRFVNYTRDALKGIVEQLGPTSVMTFQNRMALDMILAQKGGVCKMIGPNCCTYIPNNTAPDGSITKALKGLTDLSEELARNSGTQQWDTWFGWWRGWQDALIKLGIILICVLTVLILIMCCVAPCIRRMITKTMDETMTMHAAFDDLPPPPEEYEALSATSPDEYELMRGPPPPPSTPPPSPRILYATVESGREDT